MPEHDYKPFVAEELRRYGLTITACGLLDRGDYHDEVWVHCEDEMNHYIGVMAELVTPTIPELSDPKSDDFTGPSGFPGNTDPTLKDPFIDLPATVPSASGASASGASAALAALATADPSDDSSWLSSSFYIPEDPFDYNKANATPIAATAANAPSSSNIKTPSYKTQKQNIPPVDYTPQISKTA